MSTMDPMAATDPASGFSERLRAVFARIESACARFGKDPSSIELLAVSKTFPAADIKEALAYGLHAFGENYVQEGVEKIGQLLAHRQQLQWHFIGPLQSNKTKDVAEHFDWMHSVDREKIAHRLSAQRPEGATPLQVCIQVNVSGEASKSGLAPHEVESLAQSIARMPGLSLRGLMAIPEPTEDVDLQRQRFRQLAELFRAVRKGLPQQFQAQFNTLSMGMSADLESAIAESIPEAKTLVRVGTALFGSRARKPEVSG